VTVVAGTSRLGRLARPGVREPEPAEERCELCAEPIGPEHRHVLDVEGRRLLCACRPCSILFDHGGAGGGHYRLVPERVRRVSRFRLDERDWRSLRIPVELAFFFDSSSAGRVVAFYPSPVGATESLLGLDAWTRLVAANPVLTELEPDVEALLVDRTRGRRTHWLVPVDRCYALVGTIRTRWRGLAGGPEVWGAVDRFFADLERQATVVGNDGREATWQPSRSGSAT
jgi:Family of unknown function (DUF5947)